MSAIVTADIRVDVLATLRAAVEWATIHGIHVAPGGWGVMAISRYGDRCWCRTRDGGAVDPLGALILQRQPSGEVDPGLAAAQLLGGAPLALIEGITAGVDKDPAARWIEGPARQLYLQGMEVGTALRMDLLSCWCEVHKRRYTRALGGCPGCLREAQLAEGRS